MTCILTSVTNREICQLRYEDKSKAYARMTAEMQTALDYTNIEWKKLISECINGRVRKKNYELYPDCASVTDKKGNEYDWIINDLDEIPEGE